MDVIEKLADDLGQIAFRLETSWSGIEGVKDPVTLLSRVERRQESIGLDLERLKDIKARILDLQSDSRTHHRV